MDSSHNPQIVILFFDDFIFTKSINVEYPLTGWGWQDKEQLSRPCPKISYIIASYILSVQSSLESSVISSLPA